jgi:EAL domain-containing protein (putative c-di-GMP-specific phosphodiesterase class I)/DNA-binding NarL/FixJ family response regulator
VRSAMPRPDPTPRDATHRSVGKRRRPGGLGAGPKPHEVAAALAPGGIRPVLQPVFELATGLIVGYEALARFDREPGREPAEWFSHPDMDASQSRLLELAAVRAHLALFADIPEPAYLALNVSPSTAVCDELDQMLRNLPPDRLVLEIGVDAAVANYEPLRAGLPRVRSRGIRLALDDAGYGSADFHRLLELTPDIIKLDLSLTRDIDKDTTHRALASAICALARQLGIAVVAEGIETAAEFTTLVDLGVHFGQGYFMAHPSDVLLGAGRAPARPDAPAVVSRQLVPAVSVAIVDDHTMVAQAVAALLASNPRLRVAGVALDLEEARRLIAQESPDVVVCDIQLGDESGFTLLKECVGREHPRFVMYSSHDHPIYHRAAFEGGAAGFVLKMAEPDELVAAIIAAADGEVSFSPATMHAVRAAGGIPTARELAVLELLADGQSTVEVASAMGISPRTVESHLRALFDRVGVPSRTDLVLHSIREGWIRPSAARSGDATSSGRAPAWLVDAGLAEPDRGRGGKDRLPEKGEERSD